MSEITQKNCEILFDNDKINELNNSKSEITQETQTVINLIGRVYEPEIYLKGVSDLSSISEDQYPALVQPIFYLIWSTPVFKVQVSLINSILENTSRTLHSLLLHHCIMKFDSISTDRKDKFFYLIKKTFQNMKISYILNIQNYEVLAFILEQIKFKEVVLDWSDEKFVEFVANCKPFVLESIQNLKIEEELVRKYLDRVTNPKNRDALYKLFE